MSETYTLTFINNSNNNWDFCCYQNDPNIGNPNAMSLAWFAMPVASTTQVSFSWTIDYQLVWSQTGQVGPGIIFTAGQQWDASLTAQNTVGFTQAADGAFTFENQTTSGSPGTLYINDDGTIPAETAAVGINMGIQGSPGGAGSGTYIVPAQPNISNNFTPHPNYWVTFGTYAPGQVLDVGQIASPAEISFGVNVYQMYAILNSDNTWTITDQQALNAAYLASGSKAANALLVDTKFLR